MITIAKNNPKLIQLKSTFESLTDRDKVVFIKNILTPEIKKKVFFSSLKNIRSVFQRTIPDKDRNKLISEVIEYAKK